MPISTVCTDCRKAYTVKDGMAGKRFRCKECQSIVTVPGASEKDDEDDPFSGADLQSAGEPIRKRSRDDEEDVDDDYDRPVQWPKRNSKSVKKRRTRGDGMPVPALIVMTLQSLLTLYPLLNCISVALTKDMAPNLRAGTYITLVVRFAIAFYVWTGLSRRKNSARQWSRGLCSFSLFVVAAAILLSMTGGNKDSASFLIIVGIQWIMWLTIVICLTTQSSAEWFNK